MDVCSRRWEAAPANPKPAWTIRMTPRTPSTPCSTTPPSHLRVGRCRVSELVPDRSSPTSASTKVSSSRWSTLRRITFKSPAKSWWNSTRSALRCTPVISLWLMLSNDLCPIWYLLCLCNLIWVDTWSLVVPHKISHKVTWYFLHADVCIIHTKEDRIYLLYGVRCLTWEVTFKSIFFMCVR